MCATQSTYSLQSRKINYKMKKPGRLHLNQGTKVTITSNRTNIHHVNCYDTQRGTQYPFQIYFCQLCTSKSNCEKTSDKTKPRHIRHNFQGPES